MAGYSGKPLTQKLGIKPGFCIFTTGAPAVYSDIVGKLPPGVTVAPRLQAPLDLAHAFATEVAGSQPGCAAAVPRSRPMA
jgi:hypothetical protein